MEIDPTKVVDYGILGIILVALLSGGWKILNVVARWVDKRLFDSDGGIITKHFEYLETSIKEMKAQTERVEKQTEILRVMQEDIHENRQIAEELRDMHKGDSSMPVAALLSKKLSLIMEAIRRIGDKEGIDISDLLKEFSE